MTSTKEESTQGDEQPLYDIEQPHSNDVLCGRGVTTNKWAGNEQFRSLVAVNKVRLQRTSILFAAIPDSEVLAENCTLERRVELGQRVSGAFSVKTNFNKNEDGWDVASCWDIALMRWSSPNSHPTLSFFSTGTLCDQHKTAENGDIS